MRNNLTLPHGGPVHCCVEMQRKSVHVLLRTPNELQAASQTPQPVQLNSLQPKTQISILVHIIAPPHANKVNCVNLLVKSNSDPPESIYSKVSPVTLVISHYLYNVHYYGYCHKLCGY